MEHSATESFFARLQDRADDPILATASGSVRWQLVDEGEKEHWFIRVDKGEITVSQDDSQADVIATMTPDTSEGVVTGHMNAMAGVLRGTIRLDGDMGVAMFFQRLFPGPPPAHGSTT